MNNVEEKYEELKRMVDDVVADRDWLTTVKGYEIDLLIDELMSRHRNLEQWTECLRLKISDLFAEKLRLEKELKELKGEDKESY